MVTKIQNTGVNVGGSRKERVPRTGTKASGKADGLPAWLPKGVEVRILSEGECYKKSPRHKSYGEGLWVVLEQGAFSPRIAADGFSSREEAIAHLPYLFWKKVLAIGPKDGKFCIYKESRSTKEYSLCMGGFETKEEAQAYAETHAPELVVARAINPVLPKVETARRVGPDYRTGRDIAGEELCSTFGLCGVEFGTQLPNKERQKSLNACYDACCDLADVLKVERTCIGFHGLLAMAFGSRGYKKALGHFEPGRFVINLTRMNGAGCVAHEWFHAFDYYMGAKTQGILLDRGDPDLYQHTAKIVAMSNLPIPETSFMELFHGLEFHFTFGEEARKVLEERQRKAYANYEAAKVNFVQAIVGECYCPASAEEVSLAGQVMEHLSDWVGNVELYQKDLGYLMQLFSKTRGWTTYQDGRIHRCSLLVRAAKDYVLTTRELLSDCPKAAVGDSEYKLAAKYWEQGRKNSTWSSRLELAARAFAAYVEDRLEAEGRVSEFLVDTQKNGDGAAGKPYPEGGERRYIGQLFDNLFQLWHS